MVEIRELTGDDANLLSALAALHCACLPGSAITKLGPDYAASFYRMLTRSETDRVLAAIDDGAIVGGLVLSEGPTTLSRRMLTSTPLVFYLVGKFRSVTLPMLTGKSSGTSAPPAAASHFEEPIGDAELARIESMPELVHLFVDPRRRGEGLGEDLVSRCTALCREEGVPEYFVKTSADEGNAAVKFYDRLGFEKLGTLIKQGRSFVGFVRDTAATA
jgi:GNAT superfamily N-acetyltransferase